MGAGFKVCVPFISTETSLAALIAVGSLLTATCWLLMPWLPGQIDYVAAEVQEG